MFTAMLKKSRRNLQACTEVGLIEHVLNLMSDADDVIAGKVEITLVILIILTNNINLQTICEYMSAFVKMLVFD